MNQSKGYLEEAIAHFKSRIEFHTRRIAGFKRNCKSKRVHENALEMYQRQLDAYTKALEEKNNGQN